MATINHIIRPLRRFLWLESSGLNYFQSSGGDSELALSKQVPQEHLAALKAIKSALVNSGVATNRPIQIKIEKGGNELT